MSRRKELMALSRAKGQKPFRFSLQSPSKGLHLLKCAPQGWESAKFELKRNERYQGLFRAISFNELTFVKDARDYLEWCYIYEGINGNCTFTVERLNNLGVYIDYFVGKLDFSTYKITEVGVTCQITDSSFQEKIKNRESLKVNIFDIYNLNGGCPSYFYHTNWGYEPYWRLELPYFELFRRASWVWNQPNSTTALDHYLPLYLEYQQGFTECQMQQITDTDAMFYQSLIERNIRIIWRIIGRSEMITTDKTIYISVFLYVDGNINKQWDFTGVFETETLNACDFTIDLASLS